MKTTNLLDSLSFGFAIRFSFTSSGETRKKENPKVVNEISLGIENRIPKNIQTLA